MSLVPLLASRAWWPRRGSVTVAHRWWGRREGSPLHDGGPGLWPRSVVGSAEEGQKSAARFS